jgi:RNA polymerase sigma-70 factor (ECF subfamily)
VAVPSSESGIERGFPAAGQFTQTHWSIVLSATNKKDAIAAEKSLEQLCRGYWLPLYTYIRRQGESPHDAEDLTQEFFAKLLAKDFLGSVDRSKGRFRSFLLSSLKHFLSNERDRARAQKRGGGQRHLPLDTSDAETRVGVDPADPQTPEKAFEKQWAISLLDRTLRRLREEYAARGYETLFEGLKGTLVEDGGAPYGQLAVKLDMSEAAVKMAAHRLKKRYRQLLRLEIAETVASEEEVEDEMRQVFRVLAN